MSRSEGNYRYKTRTGRYVKPTERMLAFMADRNNVNSDNSVSQAGSHHSRSSSTTLRLQEEQRQAELETRAAALREQHQLSIDRQMTQAKMRLEKTTPGSSARNV